MKKSTRYGFIQFVLLIIFFNIPIVSKAAGLMPVWPMIQSSKSINALDHYSGGSAHKGIDMGASIGTSVVPVADGVVYELKNWCNHDNITDAGHDCSGTSGGMGTYGNYIILKHVISGKTYYSLYGHLKYNSINVSVGQSVYAGSTVIALSGNSGSTSGQHLHLEMYDVRNVENRQKSFQYFQNNPSVISGLVFASHIPTSSQYFGDWVKNNCTRLSDGRYQYTFSTDTAAPIISNVRVTNASKDGYTVTCTVTDPSGVSLVEFPTWNATTDPQQTRIIWKTPTSVSGSTYTFRMNVSDWGNQEGLYATHIYATDNYGNKTSGSYVKHTDQYIDRTAPIVTNVKVTDVNRDGYTVTCTVTDSSGVRLVEFPTWNSTMTNGDGAIWKTATSVSDSTYTFRMNVSDWGNQEGLYATHIYATDNMGNKTSMYDCKHISQYIERPAEYVITFDTKGGSLAVNVSQVPVYIGYSYYGDMSYIDPKKPGYLFDGWYDINNVKVYTAQGMAVDGPYWSNLCWKYNGDLTVYAHWRDCNHSYNAGVVTKSATCGTDGVKTYTCSICKATKTETISKTGVHSYNAGVVTKNATCITDGVKTYTCSTCKTTKTETISKTGVHSYNAGVVTKAATCFVDGQKVYTCTTLGCGANRSEVIKAKGSHTWNEGKVTKKPTLKTKGACVYTCTACGNTKNTSLDKLKKQSISVAKKVSKKLILKESSLRKKKATYSIKAKAKTSISYKVTQGSSKYISVSSKGVITLRKGTKKGIYKVTVTAKETLKYAKAQKSITIIVQ